MVVLPEIVLGTQQDLMCHRLKLIYEENPQWSHNTRSFFPILKKIKENCRESFRTCHTIFISLCVPVKMFWLLMTIVQDVFSFSLITTFNCEELRVFFKNN